MMADDDAGRAGLKGGKAPDHFRPSASEGATVGSGSTAAAVREELRTGQLVGGVSHSDKAKGYVKALTDWLNKNPTASPGDRAAAENVLKDLTNALSGM